METKICTVCGQEKSAVEFYFIDKTHTRRRSECRACKWARDEARIGITRNRLSDGSSRRSKMTIDESRDANSRATKKYRENNAEKIRRSKQILYTKRRKCVIDRYGGRCECCGENRYEFLAIDHRFGGGGEERKSITTTQLVHRLYGAAVISENYRILCHNCNMAIAYNSKCPHEIERKHAELSDYSI